MEIKQNLLPSSKYSIKSPYSMTPIGICVHNTANDASAKNEISYMVTNNLQTSFHFAVDDKEIWQGLPLNRNGWHAGDGATGDGNRKHIGIEICYSKSGGARFEASEERSAEFIASLLKERNWGIERVKRHFDFSGKNCPHRTMELGWQRYLNLISNYLNNDMQDLLKKYSVGSVEELDKKLMEHVGLDWGNANNLDNKSFLASDRRKVKLLEGEIEGLRKKVIILEDERSALNNKVTNLTGDLAILKMKKAEAEDKLKEANAKRVDAEKELADKTKEVEDLIEAITEERKEFVEAQKQYSEIVEGLNAKIEKLENGQINESEITAKFLDKVIEGLEGYGGERTLEGVLNSLSQREAQRKELKIRVDQLEGNPIIKFFQALKDLIK